MSCWLVCGGGNVEVLGEVGGCMGRWVGVGGGGWVGGGEVPPGGLTPGEKTERAATGRVVTSGHGDSPASCYI